jgi:hypothetical protein
MKNRARIASFLQACVLLAGFSLLPTTAQAEKSVDIGNYVVHYNAFRADTLPTDVARNYGIPRSRNRAMINIAVVRKDGGTGTPVEAYVRGSATNLNNQLTVLVPREIKEPGAVYYIDHFRVHNGETLRFSLDVAPEHGSSSYSVQFEQQFFTR